MRRKYKKAKRESFLQKTVNVILTLIVAGAISSQVCTAANNNLRFAAISDVHFSSYEENTSYKFLEKSGELLDDAIFQVNTSGPYNFVIFTGDLVNQPKKSELTQFLIHSEKLLYPWYAIDGNHDIAVDGPLTKEEFIKTLADSNKNMKVDNIYYAFTPKKGFRVIGLDSIIDYKVTTRGEIYKEQMEWLKKELDAHQKDVIILCTHVPIDEPYPSPNHKMENEQELRDLLGAYSNPIIVMQGHYHCTRAKQRENIIYISTPSLVTYPNSFRVVNINSNKERTLVDVFLKETNLKDIQKRSRLRLLWTESFYGEECDRNVTFEIKKNNKE